MKTTIVIFTALIVSGSLSCRKKDQSDSAVFEGNITITSLHEHDTIHGGTAINVQGTATANTQMHSYDLQLLDGQGNLLQEYPVSDHSMSYTFDHVFTHSFTDTTSLQLNVIVAEDDNGNMSAKNIPFVFVP